MGAVCGGVLAAGEGGAEAGTCWELAGLAAGILAVVPISRRRRSIRFEIVEIL